MREREKKNKEKYEDENFNKKEKGLVTYIKTTIFNIHLLSLLVTPSKEVIRLQKMHQKRDEN